MIFSQRIGGVITSPDELEQLQRPLPDAATPALRSSSRYSVRFRLIATNVLIVLSGIVGVVGGIAISKSATLHELNFLHVKYNHQMADELSRFAEQPMRGVGGLYSQVQMIREQPLGCLDIAGPLERVAMRMIGTIRAIDLCIEDLALADRTLASIEQHQRGQLSRESLVVALDGAVSGFRANSVAFEPLVGNTVTRVLFSMIFVLIGMGVFSSVGTIGLTKSIERDYHRLQQSETRIQDQMAYFRAITETAGDPIVLIDDNGCVDFANTAASDVFGYDNQQLVGCAITRLLPAGLVRGESRDLIGRRQSGESFPLTTSVSAFTLNSGERLRVIVIRDVSTEREAEEELLRARERDNRLNFMANITHELRTPLHGILGFAEMGEKHLENEVWAKAARCLSRIRRSGTGLLALVDDILDLSKMLMASPDMKFQSASLGRIVEGVVEGLEGLAESGNIELRLVGFDQDLPDIRVHPERMGQVVRNIVANALRFSPPDTDVQIQWEAVEQGQRITVRDSGCGIPESELESIFDPFTQSSRTKTNSGGTGLGLSISREIIEAHGGRIWAANRPDQGALVSFVVPHRPPTEIKHS